MVLYLLLLLPSLDFPCVLMFTSTSTFVNQPPPLSYQDCRTPEPHYSLPGPCFLCQLRLYLDLQVCLKPLPPMPFLNQAVIPQHSAGPHGRGQSSNFSLTSCIPLPLLKRLNTWICYFNWTALQRSSRSTLLAFRHIGLITSCPKWVLVFHEKIGNHN